MAKKHRPLSPWLSAKSDNQELRFVQVGNSLLFSKAYQSLSAGARHLYICMAMECGGRSTFRFPLGAAPKYGIAGTSFRRYIVELEQHGFIVRESMQNLRKANIYHFSGEWKGIRTARITPVIP